MALTSCKLFCGKGEALLRYQACNRRTFLFGEWQMQFGFYPGHESGCGRPRECPHLGGASVGYLVHIVNASEDSRLSIHRQLDAQRQRNTKLVAEVERLEKALEQARLELRLERQNKFGDGQTAVSYTHLTLPTNREV